MPSCSELSYRTTVSCKVNLKLNLPPSPENGPVRDSFRRCRGLRLAASTSVDRSVTLCCVSEPMSFANSVIVHLIFQYFSRFPKTVIFAYFQSLTDI